MVKAGNRPKIFIFGIDGAAPEFVKRFANEGKLPNLKRLIDNGAFGDLATTLPGVSPTAWASFATGHEPTKHGVVDFVCKKAKSYDLELQMHRSYVDDKGMRIYEKNRITKAFWEIADEKGLRPIVIHLPATFPPDRMQRGIMISGMGIQDLRDTFGVTSLYSTEPIKLAGVESKPLVKKPNDSWLVSEVEGPLGGKIPLYFKREDDQLLIVTDKTQSPLVKLRTKQWSPWVSFSFPVSEGEVVEGVTQFKLLELDGDKVQVVRIPVQPSPYYQINPYTHPSELAGEIAEHIGHYKILDRTEDGLDNETFLEDVWDRIEKKTEITKYLMRSRDWDIFVSYVHTLDNVQHVMWRHIDPTNPNHDPYEARLWGDSIEKAYQKVDWFVGETLDLMDEDNTIVLMASDHGGCSVHKWIHINTWLREHGYLGTLEEGEAARAKQMTYRVSSSPHSRPVDWKATKAYVIGAGGIYVNVKGREPLGVVQRGREYISFRNEIARELQEVLDPDNGRRMCKKVLFREQIWRGPKAELMPDIVPIFEQGYTMAMEDIFGEVLVGVPFYEKAFGRWSGTHGGPFDPWENAGIFLAYGPHVKKGLQLEGAEIIDIAPTVLHILGIEIPGDIDGKVLETIFE